MTYKLFVLKILNFSIDLNSLTWLKQKKSIKISDINWSKISYCPLTLSSTATYDVKVVLLV